MFALASLAESSEVGSAYFQETDPEPMFQGACVYYAHLSMSHQAPRVVEMAFQQAIAKAGRRGRGALGRHRAARYRARRAASPQFHAADRHLRARRRRPSTMSPALIDQHERITIYCGAGVREAHDQVIELASRLKAPIGHTLRAKEIMEHDNPYDVGLTGLIGFGGCTEGPSTTPISCSSSAPTSRIASICPRTRR